MLPRCRLDRHLCWELHTLYIRLLLLKWGKGESNCVDESSAWSCPCQNMQVEPTYLRILYPWIWLNTGLLNSCCSSDPAWSLDVLLRPVKAMHLEGHTVAYDIQATQHEITFFATWTKGTHSGFHNVKESLFPYLRVESTLSWSWLGLSLRSVYRNCKYSQNFHSLIMEFIDLLHVSKNNVLFVDNTRWNLLNATCHFPEICLIKRKKQKGEEQLRTPI